MAGPSLLDGQQLDAVHRSKTIYALDDSVVGPLNGFSGAGDYYTRNSAAQFLGDINVPTLLIHAANDPWIPASMYQRVEWAENDNLLPAITPSGGHVGFHGRDGRWHDRSVVRFLDGVIPSPSD